MEAGGFYPTTTTLPIIFETYGAAGVNAQELIRRAVNLWEDYVHGERDPAAAAIFAAGWKHKISTVLQWGKCTTDNVCGERGGSHHEQGT